MPAALFELGRWAYRARGRVVALWILLLALLFGGVALFGVGTDNTYSFPGTQSQDALDSLARTFPQFAGTSAQLIAVAPSGGDVTDADFESAVNDTIDAISAIAQVSGVSSPYDQQGSFDIASDGSAVLVSIQLAVPANEVTTATSDALQAQGRDLGSALPDGSEVSVGGALYSQVNPGIGASEVASLGIALVVLLITFGSLRAAGMPLITAVTGVGVSVAVVLIATRWVTVTSTAPLLAVMLGLAVGVDYALFIVSRHQENLRAGMSPEDSAPRAVATAGSAVVFAATTVIIALVGLVVAGVPFLTVTGVSAALAVGCAALVALSLTPALLGFVGWGALPRRQRPPGAPGARDGEPDSSDVGTGEEEPGAAAGEEGAQPDDATAASQDDAAETDDVDPGDPAEGENEDPAMRPRPSGLFGHWVRAVTRFPALTVAAITLLLGAAALPAADLRLALPDSGSLPEGSPGRITYDLIAEHFGAGANGPLILTGSVIQSTDPVDLVDAIAAEIQGVSGVADVPLATPNQTGDTAVIQVIPTGAPDSTETEDLVHRLRAMHDGFLDRYAVDLDVTGYTALGIDISERLGAAMLPFGILVVGLSLVLLAIVFRSIAVPLTAALGYVLSVGAAFGLTSLVFVHGVFAGPLNVQSVGAATSFMPIIVMGVLFGLAMDYEMFLVSRMREDWVRHRDAQRAVEDGFIGAARVVTAAAIIMTVVFGGFVRNGEAALQPIAFGLAVGVVIDAFLVRMTFIPAVLRWLGPHAWAFPSWLDRTLPHFDVEGSALAREDELDGWPDDADDIAIAADGLRVGVDDPPRDLRVPRGGILVISGGTREERAGLVLALTARAPVAAGSLRVIGRVLPTRTAAVRAGSSVVRFDDAEAALHDLDRALDRGDALVALEGLDVLQDAQARARVADVLARAARAGRWERASTVTFIVTAEHPDDIGDLISESGAGVVVESIGEPAPLAEAAL